MKKKIQKLSIKKFTVGILDAEQQSRIVGGSFGCTESVCGGTANGCNPPPPTFVCTTPPFSTPAWGCQGSGGGGGGCDTVGPQVSCL